MTNKRISAPMIDSLAEDEIFVFGSNIEGLHGGGAARTAMKWGAKWRQGVALSGQTYAIPTTGESVEEINPYVDDFIEFATNNPHLKFLVTEIGCGIAGYTPEQIAPLFTNAIPIKNIYLPQSFWGILSQKP